MGKEIISTIFAYLNEGNHVGGNVKWVRVFEWFVLVLYWKIECGTISVYLKELGPRSRF